MWTTARQVFFAAVLDRNDVALAAYLDMLEESGGNVTRERREEILLGWREDRTFCTSLAKQRLTGQV